MVIFLTGASGFIGKKFLKLALSEGHQIYAVSRKKRTTKHKNLKWLKGEIDQDWKKYMKKTNVLVHLAASGINKKSERQVYKILELNVKKSYLMILNAIKSGCNNFVIGSTSSEYLNNGLCIKKRLTTNSARGFSSMYSLSKIIFSDLIQCLSNKKKVRFKLMRIFPTYGEGEARDRLFPKIKRYAKQGRNLKILNPFEFRNFTEVDHVAKVLLEACKVNKKKKFDIFHISSNEIMSVMDFSRFFWKKFNAKGKLSFNIKSKKIFRHISDINSNWKLKNDK
jgi:2-alkyl-3-oxoalkanoate reductase|tara:strand:+ start:7483 stop:8325 length:843 start_codon:yes stop_codon:yes gene_type:complete